MQKLIQRDLNHVWHPCSQMKDFENHPPLIVERAEGSYLYTNEGRLIDAISSWWCKSLGHGHPDVIAAIQHQLQHFEHVISANTTHPSLVMLAEKLCALSGKDHVFFASDGSSAVEIALKLAIHASQIKGEHQRRHFLALSNGYHGETLATLSISDVGAFKAPFESWSIPCTMIDDIPYVANPDDPTWTDCNDHWSRIEKELEQFQGTAVAVIVEPIVQGAGGMRCYSADFLSRLATWAKKYGVYFIADEIMTGLGRTGEWLACQHAGISADMICLSKGLTSGSLPLSVVLIDHDIYQLFYNDYEKGVSFLHSHTYSGNALAVSAALATLQVMEREDIPAQAVALGRCMHDHFQDVARQTGLLQNIRGIGGIIAADLVDHPTLQRVGFHVAQTAQRHGALLRPMGRTLYWLPPLNTSHTTIEHLAEITSLSINEVYQSS